MNSNQNHQISMEFLGPNNYDDDGDGNDNESIWRIDNARKHEGTVFYKSTTNTGKSNKIIATKQVPNTKWYSIRIILLLNEFKTRIYYFIHYKMILHLQPAVRLCVVLPISQHLRQLTNITGASQKYAKRLIRAAAAYNRCGPFEISRTST